MQERQTILYNCTICPHLNFVFLCIFRLKEAFELCGCIPWDFPHFREGLPICSHFSAACFRQSIVASAAECSHCLPECESISYSYTLQQDQLRVSEYCSDSHFLSQVCKSQTEMRKCWSNCDIFSTVVVHREFLQHEDAG